MLRTLVFATALAFLLPAGAALAETPGAAPAHKPDLADRVAGTYKGDIISDARGSSKSGVTITVTRTGPNKVEINTGASVYPGHVVLFCGDWHTRRKLGKSRNHALGMSLCPHCFQPGNIAI